MPAAAITGPMTAAILPSISGDPPTAAGRGRC
jgi:hypothetical protein